MVAGTRGLGDLIFLVPGSNQAKVVIGFESRENLLRSFFKI
jgi:hypothetical protein